MRIVIPGGSGQVGRILARHFHAQGHAVTVFSRSPRPAPWRMVAWDGLTPGGWIADLERSDVCINLAGRSVDCRYTAANRRSIHESRIRSTLLLNQAIASLKHPPRLWMNASTATIYRHALDRAMDEATGELGGNEPGAPDTWNFSIDVAKSWEEALFSTPTPRTRKVAIRSAMTFSPDRGGVFDMFSALARRGLGGRQGSGDQFVSWIHEADFVRAVELIVSREEFSGVVNLASPNPLPNREFMRALRQAWGMPFGLATPGWMLEIGCYLMRTESELVLKSRRVVPVRLLAAGFQFQFPDWPAAARDLVGRWGGGPRRAPWQPLPYGAPPGPDSEKRIGAEPRGVR
ncbi:MAG: TIGR01777 family oxidoreductase [Bryobacteraceae bacterium]